MSPGRSSGTGTSKGTGTGTRVPWQPVIHSLLKFFQVPLNFRPVVESTLREFFTALQNNRDLEPSWKKSIYKVIARMDEHIPEYFKTTNFLEQLK